MVYVGQIYQNRIPSLVLVQTVIARARILKALMSEKTELQLKFGPESEKIPNSWTL